MKRVLDHEEMDGQFPELKDSFFETFGDDLPADSEVKWHVDFHSDGSMTAYVDGIPFAEADPESTEWEKL